MQSTCSIWPVFLLLYMVYILFTSTYTYIKDYNLIITDTCLPGNNDADLLIYCIAINLLLNIYNKIMVWSILLIKKPPGLQIHAVSSAKTADSKGNNSSKNTCCLFKVLPRMVIFSRTGSDRRSALSVNLGKDSFRMTEVFWTYHFYQLKHAYSSLFTSTWWKHVQSPK